MGIGGLLRDDNLFLSKGGNVSALDEVQYCNPYLPQNWQDSWPIKPDTFTENAKKWFTFTIVTALVTFVLMIGLTIATEEWGHITVRFIFVCIVCAYQLRHMDKLQELYQKFIEWRRENRELFSRG